MELCYVFKLHYNRYVTNVSNLSNKKAASIIINLGSMSHLGQQSGLYESFLLRTIYSIPLIFSFSLPKITKLLSLIPKISLILALEYLSFLLVFYFVRFKLYMRFDVCSYFSAKNLALRENFFSHQR